MAIQLLVDGPRNAVVKFTTAGTLDISTLTGSPEWVRIDYAHYSVGDATSVQVAWDATIDEPILNLSQSESHCFTGFGGLWNNADAGVTGDINVTVTGTGAFFVILELKKVR